MRLAFRLLWLLGLILFCVPLHLLWRLFRMRSPWPQRFLGWTGRAVGMKVTVVGTPARQPTLYAANHQSWIDILVLGGATGASFVSKESVRRWPVAGWLATMVGTIYISNSDRSAAADQAGAIRNALHKGKSVAFFPEGRLDNGELLPFRPALFGAVIPPDHHQPILIQPVAIDYGEARDEVIWPSRTKAGKNAIQVMSRRGTANVTLTFLEPFTPESEHHRRDAATHAETAIADALGIETAREAA